MDQNKQEIGKKGVKSLLKSARKSQKNKKRVIYGVYDKSAQPFFTRIDDFMVDHSRVPLQEKAYFFHLLAVMIDAGIPLIQSLGILAGRTKNERFNHPTEDDACRRRSDAAANDDVPAADLHRNVYKFSVRTGFVLVCQQHDVDWSTVHDEPFDGLGDP